MRAFPPRPRREPPPLLWTFWCTEWLLLSPETSAQWWHALQRAQWTGPVQLKTIFMCRAALGSRQGPPRRFLTEQLSPQALIAALEDLIHEQRLPAPAARAIEEAVLRKTHASGLWV